MAKKEDNQNCKSEKKPITLSRNFFAFFKDVFGFVLQSRKLLTTSDIN